MNKRKLSNNLINKPINITNYENKLSKRLRQDYFRMESTCNGPEPEVLNYFRFDNLKLNLRKNSG